MFRKWLLYRCQGCFWVLLGRSDEPSYLSLGSLKFGYLRGVRIFLKLHGSGIFEADYAQSLDFLRSMRIFVVPEKLETLGPSLVWTAKPYD